MKALLILAALVAVSLAVDPMTQFIAFQNKYGKVYQTKEEFEMRFNVFKNNLAIAAKQTAKSPNATFGITKFSDMTPEEFRNIILMKRPINKNIPGKVWKAQKLLGLPASFDWRDQNAVTPVYNQGQCGSCWAFSITENVESQWFLAGHALTSLSMQQVVSCDTSDDGCGGGDPPTAYQYLMSAGGQEYYSDYPYNSGGGESGSCQFNSADIDATLSNWQYVTQSQDESAMQSFLVSSGPLSICVDAETWQNYNGGIITSSDCGTSLDHCVMATGYNSQESTSYWIVRNSWGTDWGIEGYLYVQLGTDACGIAQEVTSAIVS